MYVLHDKRKQAGRKENLEAKYEDVESMWDRQEKVCQIGSNSSPPLVHDHVVVVGDEGGEDLVGGEDKVGDVADDEDENQADQDVNHGYVPDCKD